MYVVTKAIIFFQNLYVVIATRATNLVPRPHPTFHCLQYGKHTASDEKLGWGLRMRLRSGDV